MKKVKITDSELGTHELKTKKDRENFLKLIQSKIDMLKGKKTKSKK